MPGPGVGSAGRGAAAGAVSALARSAGVALDAGGEGLSGAETNPVRRSDAGRAAVSAAGKLLEDWRAAGDAGEAEETAGPGGWRVVLLEVRGELLRMPNPVRVLRQVLGPAVAQWGSGQQQVAAVVPAAVAAQLGQWATVSPAAFAVTLDQPAPARVRCASSEPGTGLRGERELLRLLLRFHLEESVPPEQALVAAVGILS